MGLWRNHADWPKDTLAEWENVHRFLDTLSLSSHLPVHLCALAYRICQKWCFANVWVQSWRVLATFTSCLLTKSVCSWVLRYLEIIMLGGGWWGPSERTPCRRTDAQWAPILSQLSPQLFRSPRRGPRCIAYTDKHFLLYCQNSRRMDSWVKWWLLF